MFGASSSYCSPFVYYRGGEWVSSAESIPQGLNLVLTLPHRYKQKNYVHYALSPLVYTLITRTALSSHHRPLVCRHSEGVSKSSTINSLKLNSIMALTSRHKQKSYVYAALALYFSPLANYHDEGVSKPNTMPFMMTLTRKHKHFLFISAEFIRQQIRAIYTKWNKQTWELHRHGAHTHTHRWLKS